LYLIVFLFLGAINIQTMTDHTISNDLKWGVIELARSWPFYFSRIFMVTVSIRVSLLNAYSLN